MPFGDFTDAFNYARPSSVQGLDGQQHTLTPVPHNPFVQQVGDVIPFRQRSIEPGMGVGTEGAGGAGIGYGGGRGEIIPFTGGGSYDRASQQQEFGRWLSATTEEFQRQKPELEQRLDKIAGKVLPDLMLGPHAQMLKDQFGIGTSPADAASIVHLTNQGAIDELP